MGGGGTETTTQTSGISNPAMNAAATTIGNQLNAQLKAGVKPYTGSMVPNLSTQTQQGVNSIFSAAGNTGGLKAANNWATGVIGSGGYNPALTGAQSFYQDTVDSGGYNPALTSAQSGVNRYLSESQADAPGYAALRAKAGDDTLRDVNAIFTSSGRFGSGSHVGNATESLGNVYAGMDMQNYENRLGRLLGGNQALAGIGQTAMGNAAGAAGGLAGVGQTAMGNAAGAAGMAPGLLQAGFLPGQMQMQAGQTMDAYNTAKAEDAARIFDATQNAGWNTLQRGGSIFSGTAPVSGTTQTNTQPGAPWWQAPVAIGGTLASAFF